jgi:hypothetical protein
VNLENVTIEAAAHTDSTLKKINRYLDAGVEARTIVEFWGDLILQNIRLAQRIRAQAQTQYNEQVLELAELNYSAAVAAAAKLGERV